MSATAVDSMRVYVHSVPNPAYPAWPDHTYVFVCAVGEAAPNCRKIKTSFKDDLFRTQFSKDVAKLPIMSQGVLKDSDGRELTDDQNVSTALQDRDDVFFELKGQPAPVKPTPTPTAASSSSSSSSSDSKPSPTIQFSSGDGQPITINRNDLASMGPKEQMMYQQLAQARDLQTKGQLKKARDIYLSVLKTLPPETKDKSTSSSSSVVSQSSEAINSIRQICHQQLGVIYLYNKFYEQARPHFEAAVKIITSSTTGLNGEIVKNIGKVPQVDLAQLISLVGQCWFGVGDFIEAQPNFERALKLLTPKGEESKDPKILAAIQETRVWLARTLYRGSSNERAQALSMFESIIQKNEHHIAALTYYAQIAIECGKKGEVIPYLLRALVASQAQAGSMPPKGASSYEAAIYAKNKKGGDKEKEKEGSDLDPQLLELVQVLLTDLVSMPGGVKTLFNELHAASNNHSALTFLAQTIKDQGGVVAAIEIYKQALKVAEVDAKGKSNLLLNLVHTMELEYQYQEAFQLIKGYLKDNQDLNTGSLKLKDFYVAIENISDIFAPELKLGTAVGVPKYCEIGKIFDEGTCHVTIPQPGSPPPKKSTAVPYPSDELNIMALLFTAVKMLYVCGGLQVIPTLVNLLEPLRVDRDLHLTQIRNEHAYYSSIAQMMRTVPFPVPAELINNPEDTIYVCGDSHSMSSAWQVIQLDGRPRPMLIQPKLVTGLKCWHLRPTCRFYPKRNFEACMRTIPQGASVIFNFGEIDCREGLIVAVEKGRYETIDEGIRLAVDVYIRALQEYQAKKSLKVYVHPITPVLDVTRPTVKQFTAHLKERCQATIKSTSASSTAATANPAATGLVYLDFFSELLTKDGSGFNMEFHLDSTHLKPTYVQRVLVPALNKVFPRVPGVKVPSVSSMSTMDAINAKMLAAQRGDFSDDTDPNGMD